MWVLGKGLQSPEDYQIGHMMNQVLLNYLIHLMLVISCYICAKEDRSKLWKFTLLSFTDFFLHNEKRTFQIHFFKYFIGFQ